jgi:hypothetical protein
MRIPPIAGSRRASGAFLFHVMRPLHAILPLVAILGILMAEPSSPQSAAAEVTAAARQAACEKILSERESPAALDRAITAARAAGVSEQAMLEARFLYHVDRREDEAIAAMLPEVLKQREAFKLEDSAIFSVEEDWLAVVEYVQAITALGKGDKIAFKNHITEAFWLSPRQAAAFSPHIESLRLEERMAAVRIAWRAYRGEKGAASPLLVALEPRVRCCHAGLHRHRGPARQQRNSRGFAAS